MALTPPPSAPPAAPTAPGDAPSRANPTNFRGLADAFVLWLVGFRSSLASHVAWLSEFITWASTHVTEMAALQSDVTDKQLVATDSASAAATSAGAAADSASAAAMSRAAIDGRLYPGTFAADPVTRPDGTAVQQGDRYFNSTIARQKTYNGTVWATDNLDAATLAAPGGAGLVGFQQPWVGAAVMPSQTKLRQRVCVDDDAGVQVGGSVDCSAGIQHAIDYLYGLGGGMLEFGRGTYGLGSAIKLRPNVLIVGRGNATVLRVLVDNIEAIGRHTDAAGGFAGIADLVVEGYADRNATLGTAKLINVAGFDSLVFRNVEARHSRAMAITGVATSTVVDGCRVYKNHRDGINITGSQYMRVTNNEIRECGDDAIACHVASGTTVPFDTGIVITGNIIRKSFGIKVLGARNATISNNDLRFWYGYGIDLALDGSSLEGENAKYAIAVTGNSFVDGMNSTFVGAGSQAAAVFINGGRSVGSGADAIAVLPGDYSAGVGAFVLPGVYENANGPTKPRASDSSIVVTGNTFKQTLEGMANFSDAGFGSLWNNTGVINPAMTSLIRNVIAVQLGAACDIRSLAITGNTFSGMARALYGVGVMKVFTDVVFSGNSISRAVDGIAFDGTASGGLNIRGTISGNLFDIDPYCENALRTTPIDGSWTATDGSSGFGINLISASGFAITGNVFTNCVRGVKLASSVSVVRGNILIFDWSAAALKGIASTSGVSVGTNSHVFADCNPASGTFGQMTVPGDSGNVSEAAAMPTSGYYRLGQFVANSAPTLNAGKVVTGWLRLTNGNAHVLNTDWAPQVVANA